MKLLKQFLNRIVVVSNSEDIRMSYGQYSRGEWVQYLDMEVSLDYKTVMPLNLQKTITYIFPNSKVEKIETSEDYITISYYFRGWYFIC